MKYNIFFLFIFFVFPFSCAYTQKSYFTQKYQSEATEVVSQLRDEKTERSTRLDNFAIATGSFYAYHNYAPEVAFEIVNIFSEIKSEFPDEYFRFIIVNRESFSEEELRIIKEDLDFILDKSNNRFYDIVSLYQLSSYEDELISELDPDFIPNVEDAFERGLIPLSLLEKARPYTTLASLGNAKIEDELLRLVNRLHFQSSVRTDSVQMKLAYHRLYFLIVPRILGDIETISSVKKSIDLIHGGAEKDFEHSSDHGSSSQFFSYVSNVILPKLKKYRQSELLIDLAKVEMGSIPKEAFLNKVIEDVNSDTIGWKEYLGTSK